MTEHESKSSVDRFLRDHIDTVPHLEALLLLWNSRPQDWSTEDMAKGLFVGRDMAKAILEDLLRLRLIAAGSEGQDSYRYDPSPESDQLLAAVDSTYRRELIRISRMIHAKPSTAILEFARAFQLKKEEK